MPITQSIKANKRAIIAIHGWTGNAESLNSLSKQWRFLETNWIFIEGPYKAKPKGFSWFIKLFVSSSPVHSGTAGIS